MHFNSLICILSLVCQIALWEYISWFLVIFICIGLHVDFIFLDLLAQTIFVGSILHPCI